MAFPIPLKTWEQIKLTLVHHLCSYKTFASLPYYRPISIWKYESGSIASRLTAKWHKCLFHRMAKWRMERLFLRCWVLTPSHTFQIINVCVHGMFVSEFASMRLWQQRAIMLDLASFNEMKSVAIANHTHFSDDNGQESATIWCRPLVEETLSPSPCLLRGKQAICLNERS